MFGDIETMCNNGKIDNEELIKEISISNLLTILNTPLVWDSLPKETQQRLLFILKGYTIGSTIQAIRHGRELYFLSAEERQSIGFEEIRNEYVEQKMRRG